jgi:peroxiredoxin
MALTVGEVAPDFKLPCAIGNQAAEFHLAGQRGKNVVVVFYPLDSTPV